MRCLIEPGISKYNALTAWLMLGKLDLAACKFIKKSIYYPQEMVENSLSVSNPALKLFSDLTLTLTLSPDIKRSQLYCH